MKETKLYSAPLLRALVVRIEQGFAVSLPSVEDDWTNNEFE